MSTAIWWVRRDLRLTDNEALTAALAAAQQVLPVFVWDEAILRSPWASERRLAFLAGGLRELDAALRQRGSYLIVRRGDPVDALAALCAAHGVTHVFAEADVSPYAKRRDQQAALCIPLTLCPGLTVRPVGDVRTVAGEPYTVFTPFSRKWKAHGPVTPAALLRAPAHIVTPPGIASLALPADPTSSAGVPFAPGEAEGQRRLARFVEGEGGVSAPIYRYGAERNRPDLAGVSQLSPYLRFGMVSLRAAVAAAYTAMARAPDREAQRSAESWLNELIWREFFLTILDAFPHVRQGSFRRQYDAIAWANDEAHFAAWCAGRTGYPIVDATMRQLQQTGWIHNRLRMVVASFLVKDLLIDWRWGERWFMQQLIDGDPAANNGGWQWTAGVGTDAAPYFRIFNPVTQGEKFDPDGRFVRQWLPALAHVPTAYVHRPWTMPAHEQAKARCVIGPDYPPPLVDHAWARERVLAAYREATGVS